MTAMIFLVQVHLLRAEPIFSGYRPDWVAETKPKPNCALLLLPHSLGRLSLNEESQGILQPAHPHEWKRLEEGDVLVALEGMGFVTASATILEVFARKQVL